MSVEGRKSIKVGSVIDGRYRLDEVLGSGTMGEVYLATQLTVNRKVAVKILNASVKNHPKLQQRFEIEARAVASVNHPNVLTLFDFAYSMASDVLYMVVEYIEGETLSEVIARSVSPKLATHVAFQTANALEHAHAAGVCHRDLKPGNIMLQKARSGERIKVLDFGLARILEQEDETTTKRRVTQIGEVYGSPAYMSPEQCVGDLKTGPPADVYSLGCIMYEMFEGELPFEYESPGKLMQAHMYEDAPGVTNPAVSDGVRDLVARMLAKTPDQRPTAGDVMDTLHPLVAIDVSMETRVPSEEELARAVALSEEQTKAEISAPEGRELEKRPSKRPTVLALVIVVFVLATIAVLASLMPPA